MNKRVAIALSGGVDSSVAAYLLQERGLDVIALHMQLFPGAEARVGRAAAVAEKLGIPFHVLEASALFERVIIRPFVEAYRSGLTPNPCVSCNRQIKFGYMLDQARLLGADRLATGHYARTMPAPDGRTLLMKAADCNKDQSYFLHVLSQEVLASVLFPLSGMEKPATREIAGRLGLPSARAKESQEICFLEGEHYAAFIDGELGGAPGLFTLEDGSVLGRHRGLHRYTIGQRKGLNVPWREPLYVIDKRGADNVVVLGPETSLGAAGLEATQVVWTAGTVPLAGEEFQVRFRYRSVPVRCVLTFADAKGFALRFTERASAVAPGQFAVLYRGDVVWGGGAISAVTRERLPA